MRSESTSAFGQPSETKETTGARDRIKTAGPSSLLLSGLTFQRLIDRRQEHRPHHGIARRIRVDGVAAVPALQAVARIAQNRPIVAICVAVPDAQVIDPGIQ